MKFSKENMLLYAVTDRSFIGNQTFYEQIESALKGGVTLIQLREKNLDENEFLIEAVKVKELCRKYNVLLIINDNLEIAIRSGADGVHVGQEDMNTEKIRSIIGKNFIVGVSVRTKEQAIKAQESGADYLGVGAVFSTTTKRDAKAVSYNIVREICNAVSIPVVAIGGINCNNISLLKGTGVNGVAIVSAIFSADNIEYECIKLKSLSRKMVQV